MTLARTDRQPESVSETILAYQSGVFFAPRRVVFCHYGIYCLLDFMFLPATTEQKYEQKKKGGYKFVDLLATLPTTPADITKSDV